MIIPDLACDSTIAFTTEKLRVSLKTSRDIERRKAMLSTLKHLTGNSVLVYARKLHVYNINLISSVTSFFFINFNRFS
jgi:hypothetical protein